MRQAVLIVAAALCVMLAKSSPTPAPTTSCNAPDASKLTVLVGSNRYRSIVNKPAQFGLPNLQSLLSETHYQSSNMNGCSPFDISQIPRWPALTADTNAIMIVRRGNCNFVDKVRNAQAVRADGVIVVNENDDSLPYMADDRTASDILIPSVIVSLTDGDELIRDVDDVNFFAFVSMEFNLTQARTVAVEMWSAPSSIFAGIFVEQFKQVVGTFSPYVTFRPRFFVYEKRESDSEDNCFKNFCQPAVFLGESVLDGKWTVEESARQICIANILQSNEAHPYLWWQYASKFALTCATTEAGFKDPACYEPLISTLGGGVSVANVNSCVSNSETLLASEVRDRETCGVLEDSTGAPVFKVNGHTYRGSLNCPVPFGWNAVDVSTCGPLGAICAGFAQPTSQFITNLCTSSPGCGMGYELDCSGSCCARGNDCRRIDQCGNCLKPSSTIFDKSCVDCEGVLHGSAKDCGAISGFGVFALVLLGVLVMLGGGYAWHRRQQRKLRTDIDHLLKQYLPGNASLSQPLNTEQEMEQSEPVAHPVGGLFSSLRTHDESSLDDPEA